MHASIFAALCVLLGWGQTVHAAERAKREPRITMQLQGLDLRAALALLSSQTSQQFEVDADTAAWRVAQEATLSDVPLRRAIAMIAAAYQLCVTVKPEATLFRNCNSPDGSLRLGLLLRPGSADGVKVLGASVRAVTPNSVGARAGFQPGDIIVKIGVRTINHTDELKDALSELKRGTAVKVDILRGRQRQSLFAQF